MADDTAENSPMELGHQIVQRHRGMRLIARRSQQHGARLGALPLLARLMRKFGPSSPFTGPQFIYATEGWDEVGETGGLTGEATSAAASARAGAPAGVAAAAGAVTQAAPVLARRPDPAARADNMLMTLRAARSETVGRTAQRFASRMIDGSTGFTVNPIPSAPTAQGGAPIVQASRLPDANVGFAGRGEAAGGDAARGAAARGAIGGGGAALGDPGQGPAAAARPQSPPLTPAGASVMRMADDAPEASEAQSASELPLVSATADAPGGEASAAEQPLPVVRPLAQTEAGGPMPPMSRPGVVTGGPLPVVRSSAVQRAPRSQPMLARSAVGAAGRLAAGEGRLPVTRGEPVARRAVAAPTAPTAGPASAASSPHSAVGPGAPTNVGKLPVVVARRSPDSSMSGERSADATSALPHVNAGTSASAGTPASAGTSASAETPASAEAAGAASTSAPTGGIVQRASSPSVVGSSALPLVQPRRMSFSGGESGPRIQAVRPSFAPLHAAVQAARRGGLPTVGAAGLPVVAGQPGVRGFAAPGQLHRSPGSAPAAPAGGSPPGTAAAGSAPGGQAGGALPVAETLLGPAPLPGVESLARSAPLPEGAPAGAPSGAPAAAGPVLVQRAAVSSPARSGAGPEAAAPHTPAWAPLPHLHLARREAGAAAGSAAGTAGSARGVGATPRTMSATIGSAPWHASGPDTVLLQRVETEGPRGGPAPDAGHNAGQSSAQDPAQSAAASSGSSAAAPQVDVRRIANEVYELIRQRLVRERESLGSRGRAL